MYVPHASYKSEVRKNMRGGAGEVTLCPIAAGAELPEKCRLFSTITLPAGASIGNHEHAGECEMFYILSGSPLITDDGAVYRAQPGDCVLTHGGHSHAVENDGDEAVVMVACIVKD